MKNNWKKFIPASVAGNILELYQFIIYGYFAEIIGKSFFPLEDKYSALFATFAVFATGSILRPAASIFLGYFGDKRGRRMSLIFSIGIMSLATLGIGLLPAYSQIGILAPISLVIFRIGQGLSMTGEEIGAALFLLENAPKNEKGYASCFVLGSVYIGLFAGSMISALIFSLFHEPSLSDWAWRIPFVLGGIMGLITLMARIKQPESFEFREALLNKQIPSNPLTHLFKKNKLSVLKTTLLSSQYAVAVYLFAIYIPNMINTSHVAHSQIMLICSSGFLLTFLISLLVGKLIDKTGTKTPILISAIGFLFLSYPIFYLLTLQTLQAILIAYGIFSLLLGISAGAMMFAILKNFPIQIRFSGSCISFNLSMSVFGGTAPLLALWLTQFSHNTAGAPASLMMISAMLTLSVVLLTQKSTEELSNEHSANYQNG